MKFIYFLLTTPSLIINRIAIKTSTKNIKDIGLVKNIDILPCEIIKLLLKFDSVRLPRTSPNRIGIVENLNFTNMYANIPNTIEIYRSKTEFFIEYDPAKQKIIIIGTSISLGILVTLEKQRVKYLP